ncbi:hypothetical protein M406DRAFT_87097 [Cryphonectria parasitica EP155]|uniref:Uncharacterized protein n=1 Tax=Cryphonectria parasitica (strain ATCC 38755 / EP155) TaxID=660469 RepID=A0A9P4YBH2_CRYP1|nr:uncharacterized protein M406DRAFT_87097 [Cryphonectria parasitica EP155]KAF3770278.1 hypothetical protein M406DRAFT_87097 [Cryphonectria parasitica EP155]
MASAGGPASQEDTSSDLPSATTRQPEDSSSPTIYLDRIESPALSGSSSVPELSRASSNTPSTDEISLRSHVSIPVVGTFPLGSLRVHRAMDPPPRSSPSQRPEAKVPLPPFLPNGDVFLILDLPPNSTVGCDSKAIGIGASGGFQGIRDIPTGTHFLWVSAPEAMSRCGYWFVAAGDRARVRVKQWDKFNEVLVDPASSFEARDHRDNVASLYPQLTPYGFGEGGGGGAGGAGRDDDAQLWRRLTACISERLLARVTGRHGVDEWLVDTSDTAAGDSGFPQTKTTQTYQTITGSGELNFLFPEGDVDLHAVLQGGGHDDDTAAAAGPPDTSHDILRLLDTPGTGVDSADLVGEMQLTFLAGLHLSNLACVEQWWHLVLKIVLRAHQLVLLRPPLALSFLTTLHAQLVYDERYIAGGASSDPARNLADGEYGGSGGNGGSTSILDIIPGKKRQLRDALTLYKRRMNEMLLDLPRGGQQHGVAASGLGDLGRAFVELEAWLWRLGWDLRTDYVRKKDDGDGVMEGMGYNEEEDDDDDDDEYRPVIVDLDDTGREVGLVSFH